MIRKNENDGYALSSNEVMYHPKVTSMAWLLHTFIINDGNVELIPSNYIERLNCSVSSFYRAIDSLVDAGFVEKSKLDNGYNNHYAISNAPTDEELAEARNSKVEPRVITIRSFDD